MPDSNHGSDFFILFFSAKAVFLFNWPAPHYWWLRRLTGRWLIETISLHKSLPRDLTNQEKYGRQNWYEEEVLGGGRKAFKKAEANFFFLMLTIVREAENMKCWNVCSGKGNENLENMEFEIWYVEGKGGGAKAFTKGWPSIPRRLWWLEPVPVEPVMVETSASTNSLFLLLSFAT